MFADLQTPEGKNDAGIYEGDFARLISALPVSIPFGIVKGFSWKRGLVTNDVIQSLRPTTINRSRVKLCSG